MPLVIIVLEDQNRVDEYGEPIEFWMHYSVGSKYLKDDMINETKFKLFQNTMMKYAGITGIPFSDIDQFTSENDLIMKFCKFKNTKPDVISL